MMKRLLIILTLIFLGCSTRNESQKNETSDTIFYHKSEISNKYIITNNNCLQTKLSKQFDIGFEISRYSDTIEIHDSCTVKVRIIDKNTKVVIDSIFMTSNFYYDFIFKNCDSMTSYSTKFNSDRLIVDNYFGDLVVADLNFDDKDDIAMINDSGGNGGPLYSYFIQTNDNRFELDNFLTDSMTYFPHEINKAKQELITYVHAGACCVGVHTYKLRNKPNEWIQVSHKILRGEDE